MTQHSEPHVLVIGSGSISVTRLPAYLTALKEQRWAIKCILTPSATHLIQPLAIAAFVDTFVDGESWGSSVARVPHIDLTVWADVVVVLPATANFIGQVAGGLAPNLATTAVLSSAKPVIFYPNVAESMARKPVLRRNIELLRVDGYVVHTEFQSLYSVSLDRNVESWGMPTVDVVISHIQDAMAETL